MSTACSGESLMASSHCACSSRAGPDNDLPLVLALPILALILVLMPILIPILMLALIPILIPILALIPILVPILMLISTPILDTDADTDADADDGNALRSIDDPAPPNADAIPGLVLRARSASLKRWRPNSWTVNVGLAMWVARRAQLP